MENESYAFLEGRVRGALSPGVIKGDGNTCSSGDFSLNATDGNHNIFC